MGLTEFWGGLQPFLPEGGSSGSLGLDSVGARFLHPLVLLTPLSFSCRIGGAVIECASLTGLWPSWMDTCKESHEARFLSVEPRFPCSLVMQLEVSSYRKTVISKHDEPKSKTLKSH